MWLSALRRETNLAVPEPVPTTEGSLLTVTESERMPRARSASSSAGRRVGSSMPALTAKHLNASAAFIARLHDHAVRFAPPPGFERWHIEEVSEEAAAYIADTSAELGGPSSVATVERLLAAGQRSQRELGTGSDVFGLIHSDLHQENYLFDRGEVGAIDFDDCGWGHFAYDLAVASSELRHRRDHADLHAALLRDTGRPAAPAPTRASHRGLRRAAGPEADALDARATRPSGIRRLGGRGARGSGGPRRHHGPSRGTELNLRGLGQTQVRRSPT